jgi:hypothetical protein
MYYTIKLNDNELYMTVTDCNWLAHTPDDKKALRFHDRVSAELYKTTLATPDSYTVTKHTDDPPTLVTNPEEPS